MTFLHCAFSNVSWNGLSEKRRSHIDNKPETSDRSARFHLSRPQRSPSSFHVSRLWSLWPTVCLRGPSWPVAPASSAGFPRPASLSSHSSAVPCTHTKSCLYFCYMTVIFFACGSASLLWLENPEGLFQGINIAIAIGYICLAFLHCVFSNVSQDCWPKKKHSHIGCICSTLLNFFFKCVLKWPSWKKGIVTWFTFVWLFSTVCFQMCPKFVGPIRSLVTLVAFVRLLSTVCYQMSLQIAC